MFLLFVIGIIFLILLTIIYFPSPNENEKFSNNQNKSNTYAKKIGSSLPTLVSYLVQ